MIFYFFKVRVGVIQNLRSHQSAGRSVTLNVSWDPQLNIFTLSLIWSHNVLHISELFPVILHKPFANSCRYLFKMLTKSPPPKKQILIGLVSEWSYYDAFNSHDDHFMMAAVSWCKIPRFDFPFQVVQHWPQSNHVAKNRISGMMMMRRILVMMMMMTLVMIGRMSKMMLLMMMMRIWRRQNNIMPRKHEAWTYYFFRLQNKCMSS